MRKVLRYKTYSFFKSTEVVLVQQLKKFFIYQKQTHLTFKVFLD